jgi:hypothetical protein
MELWKTRLRGGEIGAVSTKEGGRDGQQSAPQAHRASGVRAERSGHRRTYLPPQRGRRQAAYGPVPASPQCRNHGEEERLRRARGSPLVTPLTPRDTMPRLDRDRSNMNGARRRTQNVDPERRVYPGGRLDGAAAHRVLRPPHPDTRAHRRRADGRVPLASGPVPRDLRRHGRDRVAGMVPAPTLLDLPGVRRQREGPRGTQHAKTRTGVIMLLLASRAAIRFVISTDGAQRLRAMQHDRARTACLPDHTGEPTVGRPGESAARHRSGGAR